jgi:hypothetical protein
MGRRKPRRARRSGVLTRRSVLLFFTATAAGSTIVGSEAFTDVSGDRSVELSTADDSNAILGIDGYADAGTVPTFTNTTGSSVTVTLDSGADVEFDVNDDGNWSLV